MNVSVTILCYNEQDILPYTLRHYATFCDRMVVYDAFSTDRSREIAKEYGAEVVDWATKGVDDLQAKAVKENACMNSPADWAIAVDADELIYFPEGAFHTLAAYDADGVAVVKPRGFEMFSDTFPTTDGQIYDEVKSGAEDLSWYSKPALVAPKRLAKLIYSAGCHTVYFTSKDGTKVDDPKQITSPETYLLHCHQLGGLDRIARRYAGQQSRHSAANIRHKFGNFKDPMVHAIEKRNLILPRLQRVIPE